jgi:NADP-dependent alcohol dehydrogenase
MNNFEFYNPVRIIFGRGSIAQLSSQIPSGSTVLMVYGGGSIKSNGVYDQVKAALADYKILEFSGIEPNPKYETCMRAISLCSAQQVDYILSVGGGSVLDASKFIAAGAKYAGGDPWDLLAKGAAVNDAIPLGCVLTLPATGSEMNAGAVISRISTSEKLYFGSDKVYPRFSILDPSTTFSLPPRQTANGIVDIFVHVLEQYATFPGNAPVQDRFAEAIMLTLVESAEKIAVNSQDYDARANVMWCATQALNGNIGLGVPQDWSTHNIGHELTAFYGLDHAQTLAVLWPGVARFNLAHKQAKLAQMGRRVWGLTGGDESVAEQCIERTEAFFAQVGVPTKLRDYQVDAVEAGAKIRARFTQRGVLTQGERGNLTPEIVEQIIVARA